jgi:hypothetical protein
MSLLAVNQMTMEVVGIIRRDSDCILRSNLPEIAKNMRCVVIDYDDHSTLPNGLARGRLRSGFFKKFTEPRHLLDAELGRVRLVENFALPTDHEGEFVSPVWQNLP